MIFYFCLGKKKSFWHTIFAYNFMLNIEASCLTFYKVYLVQNIRLKKYYTHFYHLTLQIPNTFNGQITAFPINGLGFQVLTSNELLHVHCQTPVCGVDDGVVCIYEPSLSHAVVVPRVGDDVDSFLDDSFQIHQFPK